MTTLSGPTTIWQKLRATIETRRERPFGFLSARVRRVLCAFSRHVCFCGDPERPTIHCAGICPCGRRTHWPVGADVEGIS